MIPPSPQIFTLPNGLRAVLVDTPGSRGAFLSCFVGAGTRHDPPGGLGTAHLLEHLLLRGCRSYPGPSDLDAAFYRLAARLNAMTTVDSTHYFCTLPPGAQAQAVALMAEALRFPLLDAAVLETERRVVLAEMYEGGGEVPPALGHLYPGHPLGRPGAGEPEHVARLRRQELLAFHRRHYRPDQVAVVCIGDGALSLRPEIEAGFGDWAAPAEVLSTVLPSISPVSGVYLEELPGAAEISLAYALPELSPVEEFALGGLSALLCSPPSGCLYRRLRAEAGLVYEVGAGHWPCRDAGAFVVGVSSPPPDFVTVAGTLLAALYEFILSPIDPLALELMLARMRFETSLLAENPEVLAECYGEALLRGELPLDPAAQAAEVSNWTPARFAALAQRVFSSPLQIHCAADLSARQWRALRKTLGL